MKPFRVSKMRFNKLEERIAYDLNKPRDFLGRATTTRDDWSNFNVVEDKIGDWSFQTTYQAPSSMSSTTLKFETRKSSKHGTVT